MGWLKCRWVSPLIEPQLEKSILPPKVVSVTCCCGIHKQNPLKLSQGICLVSPERTQLLGKLFAEPVPLPAGSARVCAGNQHLGEISAGSSQAGTHPAPQQNLSSPTGLPCRSAAESLLSSFVPAGANLQHKDRASSACLNILPALSSQKINLFVTATPLQPIIRVAAMGRAR